MYTQNSSFLQNRLNCKDLEMYFMKTLRKGTCSKFLHFLMLQRDCTT